MKTQIMKRCAAACMALVMTLTVFVPAFGADTENVYTGAVLTAINTDRGNSYATFATDRVSTAVRAQAEHADEEMLLDGLFDAPEPLSGPEALLREAQLGDKQAQAAADYHVGDTRTIQSHYADSVGKDNREVKMVCTAVCESATIWHEQGCEAEGTYDAQLAGEMDVRIPQLLRFFGDKHVDTDGDGKIAIFIYHIDGYNIGGYFSPSDLLDKFGRIDKVWHSLSSTSNHCDCIHVQNHGYDFIMKTCLHEYQHYIEASYCYQGRNNFNRLHTTEKFINEGFSTSAEYLLADGDRYSYSFSWACRPDSGLSFMNWEHDSGNYSLAFVFSQYIRTQYAALTNDLDGEIPGGAIYKTVLQSRTPKTDDTLALIADLLYPADLYPQLRDTESRCRQLLIDFWQAVLLQEAEGRHGFYGDKLTKNIDPAELLSEMPAGVTQEPIRSGMAAFYQIPAAGTDSVRVKDADRNLFFMANDPAGFTLRFDANGGTYAPQPMILCTDVRLEEPAFRSGYTFLGWALTPDAQTPQCRSNDRLTLTQDMTLYAVWAPSPVLVLGEPVIMRRQGQEIYNNYTFRVPADGLYKLHYPNLGGAIQNAFVNGEVIEPVCRIGEVSHYGTSGETALYYQLTAGTVVDFLLYIRSSSSAASVKSALTLTRQEAFYTLTYQYSHPIVTETWSVTGETVYTVDSAKASIRLPLEGWAYTPDADAPDVLPGDTLTLTQDTTLYAVFTPAPSLDPDGGTAVCGVSADRAVFLLQPEKDGIYALQVSCTDAGDSSTPYWSAVLYSDKGALLAEADDDDELSFALHGGQCYYLYLRSYTDSLTLSGTRTAERADAKLYLDVGQNAVFHGVYLQGKTTYVIPRYTPLSYKLCEFLGWYDETTDTVYQIGDTITIAADATLTAQWSDPPKTTQARVRALVLYMPRLFRALTQIFLINMRNEFYDF